MRTGHDYNEKKIRCNYCSGSGELLGGGMLKIDCEHCDGEGHICPVDDEKKVEVEVAQKVDRRSKAYIKAIKQIMEKNKGISKKEAEKYFDEAMKDKLK